MTMHFAMAAFALLAGGAAVLIVACLALETRHDGGRHLHLFPELSDRGDKPAAAAKAQSEVPNGRPRDDENKDCQTGQTALRRTKRRREEKRDRHERRPKEGRPFEAETGEA